MVGQWPARLRLPNYFNQAQLLFNQVDGYLSFKFPTSKIWYIIVQIHSANTPLPTSVSQANWTQARAAQPQFVNAMPGIAILLNSENLTVNPDNIHLAAPSQLAMGERLEQIASVLGGQRPLLSFMQPNGYQCNVSTQNGTASGSATSMPTN